MNTNEINIDSDSDFEEESKGINIFKKKDRTNLNLDF